jgi:hypothetical protein
VVVYSKDIKKKVFALRVEGYSYSDIRERVKISKTTLSDWLTNVPYEPNLHVKNKLLYARAKSKSKVQERIENSFVEAHNHAKKILGEINERDLLMLGLGLYLGEGAKTHNTISISNSDPDILLLMLRWFLLFEGLSVKNVHARVFMYPDLDEAVVKDFWSKKLGIPKKQFGRSAIDKREKKGSTRIGKLPFGTAHLIIRARGNPSLGRYLFRVISELQNIVKKQS